MAEADCPPPQLSVCFDSILDVQYLASECKDKKCSDAPCADGTIRTPENKCSCSEQLAVGDCSDQICWTGKPPSPFTCECPSCTRTCPHGQRIAESTCECEDIPCDLECGEQFTLDKQNCACYCDLATCPTRYSLDVSVCECVCQRECYFG